MNKSQPAGGKTSNMSEINGKSIAGKWKNRIVGEGLWAAKDFNLNSLNWRTHPDEQREAMVAILGEVGWIQRVLVNKTTGNVIDGHLRVEEALKIGEDTPVPYIEVELSIEEEAKILVLFDQLSAMAGKDVEKFQELLDLVEFDSDYLANIAGQQLETIDINDFFEASFEEVEETFILEIIFESETEYKTALDALNRIGKTPKEALQKLLSL